MPVFRSTRYPEHFRRWDEHMARLDELMARGQTHTEAFRKEVADQRRRSEIFFEEIMRRMDELGEETRASTLAIRQHTESARAWHDEAGDERRAQTAALWALVDEIRGGSPPAVR